MKKDLKNKLLNKNILLLLVLFFSLITLTFVSAASNSELCKLSVSLINQDPYPAIPGEYVDVVFQVSGVQNPVCDGARFELVPSYPFSLDEGDTLQILEDSTAISNYNSNWMIPYKLRVDKNALAGYYAIKVNYAPGTWRVGDDLYTSDKLNITVEDSRTSFDAVIQEVSGSEVSLAIANIGKHTANSVVVRIPQQDSFKAIGTDGQMVGNLDSGDYTILTFSISSNMPNNPQSVNKSKTNTKPQTIINNLKFDVYYTDTIGERRIVNMELPLNMGSSSASTSALSTNSQMVGPGAMNSKSLWSNWYTIAIIIVAGILAAVLYKKYHKKIRKKISDRNSNPTTPDWVKNTKTREIKK